MQLWNHENSGRYAADHNRRHAGGVQLNAPRRGRRDCRRGANTAEVVFVGLRAYSGQAGRGLSASCEEQGLRGIALAVSLARASGLD